MVMERSVDLSDVEIVMGAHQLVDVCAQLEAAVETNNWPIMNCLLSGLDGLMRDIETSTDTFLRTHEAS